MFIYEFSEISTVVNKYLPSLSDSKFIKLMSLVHKVITPLLPPEPGATVTGPFQIFSNSAILALCDSWRNIICGTSFILFLIRPIDCSSLMSLVSPLQLMVIIPRELVTGPGFVSMPAMIRSNSISFLHISLNMNGLPAGKILIGVILRLNKLLG